MKNYLLLFLLFLFLNNLSEVNAQELNQQNLTRKKTISSWGVFFGPNISFLRGSPAVEDTYQQTRKIKIAFSLGLDFNHTINDHFNLNGKLMFERKGGIAEVTGSYFDEASQSVKKGKSKDDYIYNYYTLPILIEYKFKNFKLGGGVFTSYLKKQTLKQTYFFNGGSSSINDHTKYDTKIDFGLGFSIGYMVKINSKLYASFNILNNTGLINTRLNLTEGSIKSSSTSLLIGITSKR